MEYASQGYIHYHELVSVSGSTLHPSKVVWLKHITRTFSTLDGEPHPELAHYITPGVDYEFIPMHANEIDYPCMNRTTRRKGNGHSA